MMVLVECLDASVWVRPSPSRGRRWRNTIRIACEMQQCGLYARGGASDARSITKPNAKHDTLCSN